MRLLFAITFALISCNDKKLAFVREIQIHYKDGVSHNSRDKEIIKVFAKDLNGQIETTNCNNDGEVVFINNDGSPLSKANFSITGDCQFLFLQTEQNIGHRLSYRTGMFLSEIHQRLIDNANAKHH